MNLAGGQKSAVTEYHSNKGAWPASNEAAGVAEASQINGRYVASVAITTSSSNGVITATMKSAGVSDKIKNATLTLTGSADPTSAGSYVWQCTTPSTYVKYVPSSCRS